jgi:hypothetical protein
MRFAAGLFYIFIKKLDLDDGKTQDYLGLVNAGHKSILGLAQLITQGYFGFCNMWGLKIVGYWRVQASRAC